jgi:hypothetical protein
MDPNYTLSNNHPIMQNSNQYFFEKKFFSFHSEDRDYLKNPNSSEVEILLPQDYLNVASARLVAWTFPSNYNVFSAFDNNISMTFRFTNLYNPTDYSVSNELLVGIYAALNNSINEEYIITIETGYYNPDQMAIELTNKFNEAVTMKIKTFFDNNPEEYAIARSLFKSYDRFKIVYNSVSIKLWFGNNADQFIITNSYATTLSSRFIQSNCERKRLLPEYDNWGLPAFLGFSRLDASAFSVQEYEEQKSEIIVSTYLDVPRFYYGDAVPGSGDDGFWLTPGAPEATVYFLQAPYKISFMGPDHIYMEVDGMNCIDETSPWNISQYTLTNNQTNSIVNSSFAKIPVPSTPISQFYDANAVTYKYWNPPAERISKLKFKFRYHNGQLVTFGQFNYSFMIEFNLLKPQQQKSYNIVNADNLGLIHPGRPRYSS